MEVVFRQVPCFSSNTQQSRSVCPKQQSNRISFSDKSHLQYYNDYTIKEKEITSNRKEMKKQLKLIKGLSNNLSIFSDMGLGLNLENKVREKMISEATEVLVGQLQKLKAEKMELKRRKKEEKAKKKAAKEEESSSSSSESECEKKVRSSSNVIVSQGESAATTTSSSSSLSLVGEVEKSIINNNQRMRLGGCSSNDMDMNANKIEVCMGGKCKKSGAAVLLENFEKAIGGEAVAVVGCKCMGKCRDGPNVKLVNGNGNPLCIGVGLEDVDSIVNNLFGLGNPPTPPPLSTTVYI